MISKDSDYNTIYLSSYEDPDTFIPYPLDSMSFIAERNEVTLYSGSTKLGIFKYGQSATNKLAFYIKQFNYAYNAQDFINYWKVLFLPETVKTYQYDYEFHEGTFSQHDLNGITLGSIIEFSNYSFTWSRELSYMAPLKVKFNGKNYEVLTTNQEWNLYLFVRLSTDNLFTTTKTAEEVNKDGWNIEKCGVGTTLLTNYRSGYDVTTMITYCKHNDYIGFAEDYYVRAQFSDGKYSISFLVIIIF